jgi:2,4-didehydro-3-deoxy-L-rhamnonate hydrolase
MAINLLHYSAGNDDPTWGVVRGNTVLLLPGEYATTVDVLDQGANCQATLLNPAYTTVSPSRTRTVK